MGRYVLVPAGLMLALASCTEQDASGFERAVDSFFISILEFFLMMMLLAAFMFVLWALIFAGAATAVIAGIRRLTAGRRDEPVPPTVSQPSAPPSSPSPNREPDWLGVGMIVFGVILLLAAAPTVFSVSLGPTSGGSITIPMPLILGGAGLVWWANRRRRDQEAARAAELRAQQERSQALSDGDR